MAKVQLRRDCNRGVAPFNQEPVEGVCWEFLSREVHLTTLAGIM